VGFVHVLTQPDPAHRLDPAREADIDGVGGDQAGDEVVGLLGGAALAVDRDGAHRVRQPGCQPGIPGDIRRLLARLGHAATHDESHLARVDPGALHRLDLDGAEQVGGVQAGKEAVSLADGRSRRFDDDWRGHGRGSLWALDARAFDA
jgi:hypothetical protein